MSKNEGTCSLTLRRVWRRTSAVLYELKMLTGLPIYELINQMVVFYVENHPSMLQLRLEEVRRLARGVRCQGRHVLTYRDAKVPTPADLEA